MKSNLIHSLWKFTQDLERSKEALRTATSPAEIREQHSRQQFNRYMIGACLRILTSGSICNSDEEQGGIEAWEAFAERVF